MSDRTRNRVEDYGKKKKSLTLRSQSCWVICKYYELNKAYKVINKFLALYLSLQPTYVPINF